MAEPPSAPPSDGRFADQVVRLRLRAGLTQREVAGLLGLSEATVQRWEVGRALPAAAHLRALLTLYLERGVLGPAEEAHAIALWEVARRASPPQRPPRDAALRHVIPPRDRPTRRQDWDKAPAVGAFDGRAAELATLAAWIHDEPPHLIAVLGQGGVGKTALATRLARDLAPEFDYVYWRSLRNAPSVEGWLAGAIGLLSDQRLVPPAGMAARLALLRELLREWRALLVLDNLETVLEPGVEWPCYRVGYEGYGEVLRLLGERGHRATLLVTSRETPPEVTPSSGPRYTWRLLRLEGLGPVESRPLLQRLRLTVAEADWAALVARYRGNALALRLVGQTIAEQFAGQIGAFLVARAAAPAEVGRLLAEQLDRLSLGERSVLLQLAIAREPVRFTALAREGPGAVLGAVDRLWGRSLLEPGKQGGTVTLQPVVLEYVTAQLVAAVSGEVVRRQPGLLVRYALVQATVPEHVRRSQEQLIAAPLLEALTGTLGSAHAVDRRLLDLLGAWRGRPPEEQGYGPGTVLNLLRLLRGQLRGLDFSRLLLRQAYLQEVEAQDASLAGAHLAETVLAEASAFPAAVALSADGALLAAGTTTREVRLWQVVDCTLLLALQGHNGMVRALALSGDGGLLASGSYDGAVRLWATPSGRLLATLPGHSGGVNGVALSADGGLVASGSYDGTVRLWEAPSGRALATLEGHSGPVLGVALSADGGLVAGGTFDETVKLWEAPSGRLLATLRGHGGPVRCVALSGDGRLVASGGVDETIRLWAVLSGRLLAMLPGHTAGVYEVALSGDGRLVAGGCGDGTVKVWEASPASRYPGRPLATLQGHSGPVRGVALSWNGQVVASGGQDGTIRLWEAGSGACLRILRAERPYERLDITGLSGVTEAQRAALLALGAVDRGT